MTSKANKVITNTKLFLLLSAVFIGAASGDPSSANQCLREGKLLTF